MDGERPPPELQPAASSSRRMRSPAKCMRVERKRSKFQFITARSDSHVACSFEGQSAFRLAEWRRLQSAIRLADACVRLFDVALDHRHSSAEPTNPAERVLLDIANNSVEFSLTT